MRPAGRSPLTLLWALLVIAAVALAGDPPAAKSVGAVPPAAEARPAQKPPAPPSPDGSTLRPGEAGIRVHLDPLTGELVDPPSDGSGDRPALDDFLNTYGGDLIQEPLAGGGYMVDLRGRFQTAVVATIDPETGANRIDCEPRAAEEAPDGR